jgi:hypothetical protein
MCELVDKFWDRLKASFGRSRTILLNVLGLLGMAWTELGSDFMGFDWDVFFKHEIAVAIGVAMNVLNLLIRLYTTSAVNFGPKPDNLPQVIVEPPEAPAALSAPESTSAEQK